MVGECTSLMPPLYLYSLGQVFWIGTNGRFRRSPVVVGGYVIFAFAGYALLTPLFIITPIYWVKLFQNLRRPDRLQDSIENQNDQPPVSSAG